MYIPKLADYLQILTDEEVKDFVLINCGEYFKSTREKLYSKLNEEKKPRKVAESIYSFLTILGELEKYVELIEKTPEAKKYDAIKLF